MKVVREARPDRELWLELDYQSAEPYLRFVYDEPDQARTVQAHLFDRGLSEVSPPYVRVLVDGADQLGLVSMLSGVEQRRCRAMAALVLSRLDIFKTHPGVARRVRLAGETLLKPEPDDCYIARFGIVPEARSKGRGRFLLQACVDEARERGFPRSVAEVHPAAEGSMHIHVNVLGFEEIGRSRVEDPETGRSLEYVRLAKELS